jgi:hypothetical protein
VERRGPSTSLRISPAVSRFAHARKAAQFRKPSLYPSELQGYCLNFLMKWNEGVLRLRSGFRLRAHASLTPAKRLNLGNRRSIHLSYRATMTFYRTLKARRRAQHSTLCQDKLIQTCPNLRNTFSFAQTSDRQRIQEARAIQTGAGICINYSRPDWHNEESKGRCGRIRRVVSISASTGQRWWFIPKQSGMEE